MCVRVYVMYSTQNDVDRDDCMYETQKENAKKVKKTPTTQRRKDHEENVLGRV
jgi:hypothetical protein